MPGQSSSGLLRFLRREPLVHFLALAMLLFVANAVFSGDERDVITVDVTTQEYLIEQRQNLMLRDLSDDEKNQAIEDYIEREILVREARKRGFENNSRIRGLLIQNMRFFMTGDVPDPTEEELRAFFAENEARFTTMPTITYDHAFFADPDAVPEDMLDMLRRGADHRSIGDTDARSATLYQTAEKQIVATFGREQAPAILAIDDDQWRGPFTSERGAHFLRVAERHPGERADYDEAKSWLEQEWVMTKGREIVARELAVMRENYAIEVLAPETEGE